MRPADEIALVRENLAAAMAFQRAASRGRLSGAAVWEAEADYPGKYGRPGVPNSALDRQTALERSAANQVRASFSLSALQAHRSLQAAFRSEPAPQLVPGQPPPQLLSARCALFLIWRAIARSMLQPVWECPPLYRRRFEVAAVRFALDATRLDGRTLRWDDFGGLDSYLHLLDFCIAHARQTTGSAAEDAATAAAPPDLQEFLAAQSYPPEVAWELSELLAGETLAETPAPPAPARPDAPSRPAAPATPPVLQALREAGGPVDLLAEGRAQIYPPTPPPSPAIEPETAPAAAPAATPGGPNITPPAAVETPDANAAGTPAANPDNTPPPTIAETPANPTIPPPAAVETPGNADATAPRPPRGKRAGDQIDRFIADCCHTGPDCRALAGELYAGYVEWCRRSARPPASQRSFGLRLSGLGHRRRRRGKGRHWWEGLTLAG